MQIEKGLRDESGYITFIFVLTSEVDLLQIISATVWLRTSKVNLRSLKDAVGRYIRSEVQNVPGCTVCSEVN